MTSLDNYLKNKSVFLERVFDAIQDGIMVLDLHFTIVRANRWMENMMPSGMSLIGKKCYTLFHNKQDPCLECPYMASLETGKPHTEIIPFSSAQNPIGWFEVSVFQLKNADDKVLGAIGHVRDITKRRQAEMLLEDELTRWRILVDQSSDGIVIIDQNGKVFETNQKYSQMLGYSLEEVHQLHVWDWDTQWTKKQLLEMLQSVDDTGAHFETRHRRKDGTYYDVEISTNGTVYRGQKLVFCVCRDITERKRAEKEREQLIGKLQEALAEINTLKGILPLCSFCKKIRNDKGYWEQVDVYIHKHSQADISHSICPECMKKQYPEIEDD